MNFGYRHSRFLLSLFAVLAIAGAACSVWLPVALFPQISFPRIRIDLDAGDRPADQMAIEVTTPVEEAVRSIPGVRTSDQRRVEAALKYSSISIGAKI